MVPLEQVALPPVMRLSHGRRSVVVGLLDGPVAVHHPALAGESLQVMAAKGSCVRANDAACAHGTFMAGILAARRGGAAPGICPGCTLLVRPIFTESAAVGWQPPTATPRQLAAAIVECVDAGARVLNISAGMAQPSTRLEPQLSEALGYAARHGAIAVTASGNQGTLGSTAITRHQWVVPVVAFGLDGQPTASSNLGSSMGRHGLGAPGERVTSLSPSDEPVVQSGTSVATAFVTGAIALLWSLFPHASAAEIKRAVSRVEQPRNSVAPPLLHAWAAYQMLSAG
ncbi:peptidase S8 [Streptomyces albus subsp. albus]|nr:peptidase S8 [Streptomyces albus subsp. albus]